MHERALIVAVAVLLVPACANPPWRKPPLEEPAPVADPRWIEDARAYGDEVADSLIEERRKRRKKALAAYLAIQSPDDALRLFLVIDAGVQSLDDAFEAGNELHAALETPRLHSRGRAVLSSLKVMVERRTALLRKLAESGSELIVAEENAARLRREKAVAERSLRLTREALDEAEAKINALKTIEQSLQGGSPADSADDTLQ